MFEHYAIIDETDTVLEYPTNPRVFLTEQNCYNVPEYWPGGILNGKKYVYCHNFEPTCPYDKNHKEGLPLKDPNNGLWYRQYYAVDATPEEMAQRTIQRREQLQNTTLIILKTVEEMQLEIAQMPPEVQAQWQNYKTEVAQVASAANPWEARFPPRPTQE
jgi:hypothetical protein